MSAIRVLLNLLIGLLLFATGLVVLRIAWPESFPGGVNAAVFVRHWSPVMLGTGLAMVGLPILRLLAAVAAAGGSNRFVVVNTPNGALEISTEAIREYLLRMEQDFSEVEAIRPRVRGCKDSMCVVLECRVRAGTPLPELSQRIRDRVHAGIEQGLGLPAPKSVTVRITEIQGAGPVEAEPVLRREAVRPSKVNANGSRYGSDGMITI